MGLCNSKSEDTEWIIYGESYNSKTKKMIEELEKHERNYILKDPIKLEDISGSMTFHFPIAYRFDDRIGSLPSFLSYCRKLYGST